ncbi:MAG: GH116 family glycosyl-hydrolase [Planctomycetota bacterium]
MARKGQSIWPVLKEYDQDHIFRIALPLGGIGTGTVSLGGRGNLQDWEIMNRPAKGFTPKQIFFALYTKPSSGEAVTRALEGVIQAPQYEGASGATASNHSLPRFRECSFAAAYPFGQVRLSDLDVPLDVRIEAFNPMIPGDADASGIPVAVLRFVLINKTPKPVTASVCGSVRNFIGHDGAGGSSRGNFNTFQKGSKIQGIFMQSEGVDHAAEQFGTMALTTTAKSGVTYRTAWANVTWGDSLLDFWDDFSANGKLTDRDKGGVDDPVASLAVRTVVPARGTKDVTFLLTWHFPNRRTWTPVKKEESSACGEGCCDPNRIGNYYTTQYRDAWDAAAKTAKALPRLEEQTIAFAKCFCESDLPDVVKEAALFNLSTLRSQTCFRTEDGRFFGWEGCHDRGGCCHGSCTHVWNYEHATAFLFGDLACRMREVEFLHATKENGHMSFRVNLPIDRASQHALAAADGQMGCLMKLYRDWQLSGDDAMLQKLWSQAKKALAFCWEPGGWDADRNGVMEGCQHNTMDVEYYGPNPQMGGWYLGALRAGEEMAKHLGDEKFAMLCKILIERGSQWIDANLFNGDYYEHEIRPPGEESAIAPGLRHEKMGARDLKEPELQLGSGCLVDQLVGQYMAHVCGLGYLLDKKHVKKTLQSIMKHNFQGNLYGHFNHFRTFALNEEAALLMATYPKGRRPKRPFPYCNEVMTGFEYTAAVHMLYEGMVEDGLRCIAAVRERYDGRKRSPFDEAECGHHYARAMASWAAVLALTGFQYSGVTQTIQFASSKSKSQVFWSNGYAWGVCTQKPAKGKTKVGITVLHGALKVRRVVLDGVGAVELPKPKTIEQGKTAYFQISR